MTSPTNAIWTYEELKEQVGFPPEGARSIEALLPDTPDEFKEIVQYAAIWGIGDDCYREDLLSQASEESVENLKWVFEKYDARLLDWLAGPEVDQIPPTEAYVAFTCLTMAAL